MPKGEKGTAKPYLRSGSAKWNIRYYVPGEAERRFEATGSKNKQDAWDLLRKRQEQIANGTIGPRGEEREADELAAAAQSPTVKATATGNATATPAAGAATVDDLLNLYLRSSKGKASYGTSRSRIEKHLRPAFGMLRPEELTSDVVRDFKEDLLEAETPAAPASINRMFEILLAAYKLGREEQPPLTNFAPHVKKEDERGNVREGFLTHREYLRMREALPEYLKPLLDMGYYWGMRRGELLDLAWSQVDWDGGFVRLKKMQTKTKVARSAPLYAGIREKLEAAFEARDKSCPYIVCFEGHQVVDPKKSWHTARVAAGLPELLIHDLRRCAARNMDNNGVPRTIGMLITGHKTESMYRRYCIGDEAGLQAAGDKMAAYFEGQEAAIAKKKVQPGEKKVQSIADFRKRA